VAWLELDFEHNRLIMKIMLIRRIMVQTVLLLMVVSINGEVMAKVSRQANH
jgi:hypothetical protein